MRTSKDRERITIEDHVINAILAAFAAYLLAHLFVWLVR